MWHNATERLRETRRMVREANALIEGPNGLDAVLTARQAVHLRKPTHSAGTLPSRDGHSGTEAGSSRGVWRHLQSL